MAPTFDARSSAIIPGKRSTLRVKAVRKQMSMSDIDMHLMSTNYAAYARLAFKLPAPVEVSFKKAKYCNRSLCRRPATWHLTKPRRFSCALHRSPEMRELKILWCTAGTCNRRAAVRPDAHPMCLTCYMQSA